MSEFFIAAFLKGLRTGAFSEALLINRRNTLDEICTRVEKHIDVEEEITLKRARDSKDDHERDEKGE